MDESDDLALLRAWQAGDTKAGSALFDRHFEALYRFFSSKAAAAADDLVQQTLLACVKGGSGFRGDASFRAYLLAIARRELYRWFEKSQRDAGKLDFDEISVAALGTGLDTALVKKGEERVLLEALRRLPLEQQIVLELYFFEHIRGHDLVVALGIPTGTVRSRIRLALERLRKELASIERDPEALTVTMTTLEGWAEALRADRSET